ncbi:hypothetical protein A2U01_0035696, partial [Trifolium medium]|nr:hypothetical protein [Trifolium medium]
MEYELQNFWGSISGDPNAEPEDRFSTQIHNPAIRYFHMILAHTIFGNQENDTAVTKEELFIMFCAFQGRPVNLAPFILANFDRVIENLNRRICICGFVTLLARAIGLHTHPDKIIPLGGPIFRGFGFMDLLFCAARSLISNLGSATLQLVINLAPVHEFTLPNPERTSVHDKKNWLYDLENQDEHDLETPPFYYQPGPLSPAHSAESSSQPIDPVTAKQLDLYHLSTLRNQPPPPVDHT